MKEEERNVEDTGRIYDERVTTTTQLLTAPIVHTHTHTLTTVVLQVSFSHYWGPVGGVWQGWA